MFLDVLSFLQKYVSIEAFIPFFFFILYMFVKHVYKPWNQNLIDIKKAISKADTVHYDELEHIKNMLKNIHTSVTEHKTSCAQTCNIQAAEIRKIIDKLNVIESNVNDIVSRLERVKDDAKDGKIDLNQQLFSIKQEISDLKAKIEPLLFVSRGIK